MFFYYLESTSAPGRKRELHRADCWYLLKQNLKNYELLGSFEHYGLALHNVQTLTLHNVKKCPFCSE